MKTSAKSHAFLLSFLLCCMSHATAALSLGPLFKDGAVLQREMPVPVWGKAAAGEEVTVEFVGQKKSAVADDEGRWMVRFEPLEASADGRDMIAIGSAGEEIRIRDVVVGEVWLCSGQSNMEWDLRRSSNPAQEIEAAKFPLLREFSVARVNSEELQENVGGGWMRAEGSQVAAFSAVAYHFGRELHEAMEIPVGLISAAWGATMIEAWMSPEALAEVAPKRSPRTRERDDADMRNRHTGLFQGMIHPLIPYAIRGILWYQGERNAGLHEEYARLFPALITDWRKRFGQPEMPFYWVQLANFEGRGEGNAPRNWAWQREAQASALSLPATGMAVAIDIGEANNIHPGNKREVGRRLALLAKARIHGMDVVDAGPSPAEIAPDSEDARRLRILFSVPGGGTIAVRENAVAAFQIAGEDGQFHPAEELAANGNSVLVFTPKVTAPRHVRYAWGNNPAVTIYGPTDLPAAPFRTDKANQ
jgi:sialate O-acetylesterase